VLCDEKGTGSWDLLKTVPKGQLEWEKTRNTKNKVAERVVARTALVKKNL
jgi:hypothetical protein